MTAQRRDEKLQDVPISITALGGDQLTRNAIVSTNDLTSVVPGLLWGRSTNFSQPTIRGIGSRNASAGDEPNVATFLDGVYQPDQSGLLFELSNVERIEILKGPQSTLFGRNATGGAINIVTRRPSLTQASGNVAATYGRFDFYRVGGYLSVPLIDNVLGASLSAVKFGDHGYVRNVFLNRWAGKADGTVFRGKVLIQPAARLSIQLNGLYVNSFNNVLNSQYALNGNSAARLFAPGASPAAMVLNPDNLPAEIIATSRPYTTSAGREVGAKIRQRMVDAHFSWDLDFATLSGLASIASTRVLSTSIVENSAIMLSQAPYDGQTRFRNQELVLTSRSDRPFTWLVGVTGFQSKAKFDPLTSINRNQTTGAYSTVVTFYGQNTGAFAAFAEGTLELLDRLFVTGGIRFNRDRKTGFNQAITAGTAPTGTSTVFKNMSPRAVVRYELTPDTNIYASYTKGFKSGTYNAVTRAGSILPAGPETVDAFELGAKATLAPGLRFNAAAFYYNYSALQVSVLTFLNGVPATTVQNAGNADIKGLEATLEARVTPRLTVNAALTLLDTKTINFPNASVNIPKTTNGVVTNTGNTTVILDVSGNQLIRSPKRTFSIGATYIVPVGSGTLTASGNAFFSSRYFLDLTNRVSQGAYEVVNGSITYRPRPDKGLYASAFVQNLTNQKYFVGVIESVFADTGQVNKPRWAGVTVGFDF